MYYCYEVAYWGHYCQGSFSSVLSGNLSFFQQRSHESLLVGICHDYYMDTLCLHNTYSEVKKSHGPFLCTTFLSQDCRRRDSHTIIAQNSDIFFSSITTILLPKRFQFISIVPFSRTQLFPQL